jgi:hypothetical protein
VLRSQHRVYDGRGEFFSTFDKNKIMKNKPIPYSKTLLGTILLIMSASSFAATQSIPQYIPGAAYHGGDQVQNIGKVYECKPWPCGKISIEPALLLFYTNG